MGTQRVGTLPDTAPWRRVVGLIADAADVSAIAFATTKAALAGLQKARGDEGFNYSFFLLGRFAAAAHDEDFVGALRREGFTLPNEPDLFDLVAAFTEGIDRRLQQTLRRTDLGEMAQLAAVETLTRQLRRRATDLFETGSAAVRQGIR